MKNVAKGDKYFGQLLPYKKRDVMIMDDLDFIMYTQDWAYDEEWDWDFKEAFWRKLLIALRVPAGYMGGGR